ncbi:MAG TPA: ABC transporter permease [Roseiarcus sp.]|jgi:putative spermidine/putrescine transport system permease protein
MTNWAKAAFFAGVATFMAAPIVVIAGVSLNAKKALSFPPRGIGLDWYQALVRDAEWSRALLSSVTIAALAAVVSVALAFPIAWFLWRHRAPWARLVMLLGVAPFVLPPVTTALSFLIFWTSAGLYGAPWTVVVSHGIYFVTLPLVTTMIGFAAIDPAIPEAAAMMGADDGTIMRTVTLPLVGPYIVSGFAFAFVLSLNEYIVAYMTVGFTVETLPIKIFNALRYGYTPIMASASIFFVLVAAVIFGLVARFGDLPKLLGAWARDS